VAAARIKPRQAIEQAKQEVGAAMAAAQDSQGPEGVSTLVSRASDVTSTPILVVAALVRTLESLVYGRSARRFSTSIAGVCPQNRVQSVSRRGESVDPFCWTERCVCASHAARPRPQIVTRSSPG